MKKNFKVFVVHACSRLGSKIQLCYGDNVQYRGILDIDNQVVAQLRHNVAQSLRQNNAAHSLDMVHTDSNCCFLLSRVNRFNTATHSFCHVCTGYNRKQPKSRQNSGDISISKQAHCTVIKTTIACTIDRCTDGTPLRKRLTSAARSAPKFS